MMQSNESSESYLEQFGIANILGLNVSSILLANHLNDLQAFCTSIVAR
jgi:hypothetical protein